jgi:hypothetical protein
MVTYTHIYVTTITTTTTTTTNDNNNKTNLSQQYIFHAKTVVERQTLRLLVGANNTGSTAI